MTGAIAPLADFSQWARGSLLVIVLLVLGVIQRHSSEPYAHAHRLVHFQPVTIQLDARVQSALAGNIARLEPAVTAL